MTLKKKKGLELLRTLCRFLLTMPNVRKGIIHTQRGTHTHNTHPRSFFPETFFAWYLITDSHLFLLKPPGPLEHSLQLSHGTGDTI